LSAGSTRGGTRPARDTLAFTRISALVLLVTLALVACGGGGGGGGATKTATGGAIDVNAYDTPRFDVKTIKASPGDLKITLREQGSGAHTFAIKDKDFELKVDSGKRVASDTINLSAGTYEFECTIPGHAAQGMKGKIVVA
jgi:plastocyanin